MTRTILIIDVSHLCYRALYSSPDLSHRGVKTGVLFGVLRSIMDLRRELSTDITVFCFDSKQSKRKEFFPDYKKHRHGNLTQEEEDARIDMYRQMLDLRLKYLPRAGFNNIFIANGYEADDIAASVVINSITEEDSVIMVTGDKDYYQLLRPNVRMYDSVHNRETTIQSFMKDHGFSSNRWPEYLSLCGCSTDNVPGIAGVGPVRATQFLTNQLKKESKPFQAIKSVEGKKARKRNSVLVTLPYPGTPIFELKPDSFNLKGWRSVCKELGAATLTKYTS